MDVKTEPVSMVSESILDRPSATKALIDERGAMTYVARSYDASGVGGSPTQVQGLIMVRDKADYVSLGGPYYRDDLGNLIRLGAFQARQQGGRADFTVTYLHNGGMQLAIDFRRDRVVDALIEVTRTGRRGVFINPELQGMIDCFIARTNAGENPLDAFNACVGRTGEEGGIEGGASMAPSGEYDRLSEPNCGPGAGSGGTGLPGGSTQQNGTQSESDWAQVGETIEDTSEDGTVFTTVRVFRRSNSSESGLRPDVRIEIISHNRDTGDHAEQIQTIDHDTEGTTDTEYHRSRRTERREDGTVRQIRHRDSQSVNGRSVWDDDWTTDPGTGECTGGDCPESDPDDTEEEPRTDPAEGEEEPEAPPPAEDSEAESQPGPECEFDGTCPVADPRCEAPRNDIESMWDCVARTGDSPQECLARIRDAVYATTGCELVPGPAGQQVRECPQSPPTAFTECLREGGSVYQCLQQMIRDAGGAEFGHDENDDLLAPFRGVSGADIDFLETSEVGAILFALCAQGVEQFCRDNPGIF
jgi:hypothetical protein